MAGMSKEARERLTVELFFGLRPGTPMRVIAYQPTGEQGPDFLVEVLDDGLPVGVEVTDVLEDDDGRDRAFTEDVHARTVSMCHSVLGSWGDVDVRIKTPPSSRAMVERWFSAFRPWLEANRTEIMEKGGQFPAESPEWARTRLEAMQAFGASDSDINACRAELLTAVDLEWLHVSIAAEDQGDGAWRSFASHEGPQLADRHEHDLDEIMVESVARKCRKAAGYKFRGPLWLLLRSVVRTRANDDMSERVAGLPGIGRFAQIWLLEMPAHVDVRHPPRVRCLRRERAD